MLYITMAQRCHLKRKPLTSYFQSQSFEHVLNPYDSMAEVARCLKPGGSFIGSVSFLEPYHAFSTFGYSPHGFITVAQKAGLVLRRLHPETDGLGLIFRKLLVITKQSAADKAMATFTIEFIARRESKNNEYHDDKLSSITILWSFLLLVYPRNVIVSSSCVTFSGSSLFQVGELARTSPAMR